MYEMHAINFEPQANTLYPTLTGELWDVLCKDLGENWQCYKGTTLCPRVWLIKFVVRKPCMLCPDEWTLSTCKYLCSSPVFCRNGFLANFVTQNGCHFPGIFKLIFSCENCCILIQISLRFVDKDLINNMPSLVRIMVWHWTGDEPLSEPILV